MVNDWVKLGAVGAVLAYFGGYQFPAWAPLAASGLVIAGIGALFATGKINDLLPDPPRVRLVQVNANNDDPLACWSLSPDKFAEMQVEWGPLYPHEQAHGDVYECYAYDASSNVAVGTWRRSLPGSSLVGRHDTDDVLDVVGELRGDLEPAARRGQELRQALPAIVRRVKHDTMEAQNAALDPSAPMITDQPTVDEIITSELPEELRPGRLQNGDLRDLLEAASDQDDNQGDWGDGLGMVLDDDLPDDALEPVPTDPLVNDGGHR
ncbi:MULTISPECIES: hypothetical protein [unclassified Haloferax]|uniref:hypothetical protein n=1 Tax=unclassified Haloferax TaxID=2625095 RepID=UPI0002B24057|nr:MULTISPECIES: hypothetical protein [unclassified Haloferax]ELZ57848.1 hypothetical protein C460_11138 [Haloferax sp. ATCC BAA-646]ELZ62633.1 hypothetical protein C459_12515 [Haloferax sp. ATCC BAA-645]ELZ63809.1 hypothetical protein C458_15172 [Haloferax sp. ATCC BAA-644]